jgi:CBS domain containing-hemolysin-like protein
MPVKFNKIKEFGLLVPTRDIQLRSEFDYQTRYLSSGVEQEFIPFKNDIGAWKILIEVVPTITDSRIKNSIGVLVTQVIGDAEKYLRLKKIEKETLALSWLQEGSTIIFNHYGWQIEPVVSAIERVKQKKCVNIFTWKKNIPNRQRTASVTIEIELDENYATISALFLRQNNKASQRVTILTKRPSEFLYIPLLGRVEWIDERSIELISVSNRERWRATFDVVEPSHLH